MSNIQVGIRVILTGLSSKNLNDQTGIVVSPPKNIKEGRVAVKLDIGKRIVSIKRENVIEMKTNWTNIKNSLGITRRGKFKSIYAFGSSRKNSYKDKTIKQLKAMLSAKGVSTSGMTNRRNLENALTANSDSNRNVSAARRRLENNNANTMRNTMRKEEQSNLFGAPLANLIEEAIPGIARFGSAVEKKSVPLLRKPGSTRKNRD